MSAETLQVATEKTANAAASPVAPTPTTGGAADSPRVPPRAASPTVALLEEEGGRRKGTCSYCSGAFAALRSSTPLTQAGSQNTTLEVPANSKDVPFSNEFSRLRVTPSLRAEGPSAALWLGLADPGLFAMS